MMFLTLLNVTRLELIHKLMVNKLIGVIKIKAKDNFFF